MLSTISRSAKKSLQRLFVQTVREKQQILRFKKLEPAIIKCFCLENNNLLIIKIVGN